MNEVKYVAERYRNDVMFHTTTDWMLLLLKETKLTVADLHDCVELAETIRAIEMV